MPHNFHRPAIPYQNISLQNDDRYKTLTNPLKAPPGTADLDGDFNYIIDSLNILDQDIIGVIAGAIPGSSDPANANKLTTTDGAGNISWIFIRGINIQDASIAGSKLINSSVTSTQIADGSITSSKLAPNSVSGNDIVDDAISTNKIVDEAITTDKIEDQAITHEKIAADAVETTNILDGAVTDVKINAVFNVPKGGTGLSTLTTPYGILCAGTTATGNIQNAGTGTAGQVLTSNGANSLATFQTPVQAAVKATQITGTSLTTYVNPAVQQYHASACKFWAFFNGTLTGTNAPIIGYNIANITRNSVGDYTINFITPFTTSNYCPISIAGLAALNNDNLIPSIISTSTSSFNMVTVNINQFKEDSSRVYIIGFGVQ